MITGMINPTSGEIIYNGEIWSRNDLLEIGSLIEQPPIYENLTARQNLKVRTLLYKLPESRIEEVLEVVQLTNTGNEKAGKFSIGMRQRCAIARGFNYDCDLLLMDEPFKSLDYNLRIEMLSTLINLWKRRKKSILFITHEIDEAITVANRIIVLKKRPTSVAKEIILDKESIGNRDINSNEFIQTRREIISLLR